MGHLVNALYVWGMARAYGSEIVLRMEDHDRQRCKPAFEAAILDDLDWLGLQPDIAPTREFRSGATAYRQSDNLPAYQDALSQLASRNKVYACSASRKELSRLLGRFSGTERPYPGLSRRNQQPPEANGQTRLHLPPCLVQLDDGLRGTMLQTPFAQCGDLQLRDRHGNFSYQFAVTLDDWHQSINWVIRGEDLLGSTGRQVQLGAMLGRPSPAQFYHHGLLHDTDGQKLSKRQFSTSLAERRASGATPGMLFAEAASAAGLVSNRVKHLCVSELPKLFLEPGLYA